MTEVRPCRPPGYLPVVNSAHPDLIFTEIRGGRLQTLAFEMCASQHAHKTSAIYRGKKRSVQYKFIVCRSPHTGAVAVLCGLPVEDGRLPMCLIFEFPRGVNWQGRVTLSNNPELLEAERFCDAIEARENSRSGLKSPICCFISAQITIMNRPDPIADWFSEKQKLLGENLLLPDLPPIEISDEDPPALRGKRNGDEQMPADDIKFDFERLLGCYDPERKRITIWRKGIEFCCDRICPEGYDKLFELVLVHELGHWFHNEAETGGGECWDQSRVPNPDQKRAYEKYTEYSEAWAQWFAWVYANEKDGDLRELFLALEKNQSKPYKAWRVFCKYIKVLNEQQATDCVCEKSKQNANLRCLPKLRQSNDDLTFELLKKCIEMSNFREGLDSETADTFGDFIAEL